MPPKAAEKSGDTEAQADAAAAMVGSLLGGGDQVEALAPDALKPFMPERLGNFKRTSISVERNGAMGVQVSTGHASYQDADNNQINLEITDMGGAKGIMALAGFANVESERQTETGYEKTYKQDGRLVSERWDTIFRRPRREWLSFLWVLKCSVRLAIRSDRIETWTSAPPVSLGVRLCSPISSALRSTVIDIV